MENDSLDQEVVQESNEDATTSGDVWLGQLGSKPAGEQGDDQSDHDVAQDDDGQASVDAHTQAQALQIYNALMDPTTTAQAIELIHSLTGYKPVANEDRKAAPLVSMTKPEDWSDGDWEYYKMTEPVIDKFIEQKLASLGVTGEFVQSLSGLKTEVESAKKASELETRAIGKFKEVKAELKRDNLSFPDFDQNTYVAAIKKYPTYRYRDAVKLYMTDTAAGRQVPPRGKPTLAGHSNRMGDAPADSTDIVAVLSKKLREHMLG